jgi:hypothetical protein
MSETHSFLPIRHRLRIKLSHCTPEKKALIMQSRGAMINGSDELGMTFQPWLSIIATAIERAVSN